VDTCEGNARVENHARFDQGFVGGIDQKVIFTEVEASTKAKVSMNMKVFVLFFDKLHGGCISRAYRLIHN